MELVQMVILLIFLIIGVLAIVVSYFPILRDAWSTKKECETKFVYDFRQNGP